MRCTLPGAHDDICFYDRTDESDHKCVYSPEGRDFCKFYSAGEMPYEMLKSELFRVMNVAGEALGTHPHLRNSACVDVLADMYRSLGREVKRLRALFAEVGGNEHDVLALVTLWSDEVHSLKHELELLKKPFSVVVEIPEPCINGDCSTLCPLNNGIEGIPSCTMDLQDGYGPGPGCPRYEDQK